MASSDFTYLSYLILFVLVLYFLILFAFLIIRRYEVKARMRDRPPTFHMHGYDDSSFTFEWTTRFEDVADCLYGRGFRTFLAGFRAIACLFFFSFGLVVCGLQNSQSFNYFDGWNVIILFLYFLSAAVSSILLVRYANVRRSLDDDASVTVSPDWSLQVRFVAVSAHLLFEMAGCNTLLVLFGRSISVSSTSELQIVNAVAIAFLCVDLSLSRLKVRFDQYPACAAWLMFYLLIVWPSVFTGSMSSWPYSFLDTDTSSCFAYYLLLFVADFVCHTVWYLLFRLKQAVVHYFFFGRNGLHRDETRPMIELSDLNTHRAETSHQHSASGSREEANEPSMADSFYTLPEDRREIESPDRDEFFSEEEAINSSSFA